jgi:hypothetical protein
MMMRNPLQGLSKRIIRKKRKKKKKMKKIMMKTS